jgi:Putative auto-transporter adhesin, head GIN domain
MKHILFLFFTLTSLVSCRFTTGSGNIISETRTVSDFDGITVWGSFEVEVKTGPATSVVVEADDNIIKYIKTSVSGNTLKIRTEDLHNYSNVHMKIYITTPSLNNVKTSASAEVEVKDILTGNNKLSFRASSSSSISAEVNAPEIEADVSSSATITLSGKTKTFKAEASSSAEIKAFDLLSENTTANVSSSASIQVFASIGLNAKASSSGSVDYKGAAAVNKSISSSGSVEKKD